MDKLTRKELKSDRFALEFQNSVEYVSDHRRMVVRYGIAAVVVVVLILAIVLYRQHQHAVRADALTKAMQIQNANVGPAQNEFMPTFATAGEREKAANKAFTDIATKYSGSEEAYVSELYMGLNAGDDGNLAEAERRLKLVADNASKDLASQAKLSLAQVYASEGKQSQAEALLHDLIDHPTALVSKEQAIFSLAHIIAQTKPAEARKMIEPYRASDRAPLSRAAISFLTSLPKQN